MKVKRSVGEVGAADIRGADAAAVAAVTSRGADVDAAAAAAAASAGPVVDPQPTSWTVYRRYNGFHQLRKKLMSSARTAHSVDEFYFPPKAIFSNIRQSIISKRVKWLGEWINNMLSHPLDHVRTAPDLLAFVDAPEPEEPVVVFQKLPPPVRRAPPKWPEPTQVIAAAAAEVNDAAPASTSPGSISGGACEDERALESVTDGNATDGYATSSPARPAPSRVESCAVSDTDNEAFHDAEDSSGSGSDLEPTGATITDATTVALVSNGAAIDRAWQSSTVTSPRRAASPGATSVASMLSADFGTDDDTDGVSPSSQRPPASGAEEQHARKLHPQRRQQHTYIAPTGTSASVADSSDDEDEGQYHSGDGGKSNTVAGILTALVAATATVDDRNYINNVGNTEWQSSPVHHLSDQRGTAAAAARAAGKKAAATNAAATAAAAAGVGVDPVGAGTGAGSDDDKASLFETDGLTSGDDYASAYETDTSSARNRVSSYASATSGASDDDYLSAAESDSATRNRISSYISATSGVDSDDFFDANSNDGDGDGSGSGEAASDTSTESALRSRSVAKLRGDRNVAVNRLRNSSNRSSAVFRSSPLTLSESMGSLSQITAQAAKQKVVDAHADAELRAADAEASLWMATTVATRNRPINCICIWPAGGLFATGGRDGRVCAWELEPKVLRPTSPQQGPSASSAGTTKAAAGAHVASNTTSKSGGYHDRDALQSPVVELEGHCGWVRAVAFAPNGAVLASGGGDTTVRLWSTNNWECVTVLNAHTGWVRALAFAAALPSDQNDSMRMVSGANDSVLRIWKETKDTFVGGIVTWKEQVVLKGHKKAVLACCTRGPHVFSSSADGTVRVWALEDGHCLRVLTPQHQHLSSVGGGNTNTSGISVSGSAGSTHRRHLYSCDSSEFEVFAVGSDGLISAWKIGTWSAVPALQLGNGQMAIAAGPDGKRVAIAGDDAMLRVYDVVAPGGSRAEGYFKLEACGPGHASTILDVVVVPLGVGRGSSAITVSRDGTIKKWTPGDESN